MNFLSQERFLDSLLHYKAVITLWWNSADFKGVKRTNVIGHDCYNP